MRLQKNFYISRQRQTRVGLVQCSNYPHLTTILILVCVCARLHVCVCMGGVTQAGPAQMSWQLLSFLALLCTILQLKKLEMHNNTMTLCPSWRCTITHWHCVQAGVQALLKSLFCTVIFTHKGSVKRSNTFELHNELAVCITKQKGSTQKITP